MPPARRCRSSPRLTEHRHAVSGRTRPSDATELSEMHAEGRANEPTARWAASWLTLGDGRDAGLRGQQPGLCHKSRPLRRNTPLNLCSHTRTFWHRIECDDRGHQRRGTDLPLGSYAVRVSWLGAPSPWRRFLCHGARERAEQLQTDIVGRTRQRTGACQGLQIDGLLEPTGRPGRVVTIKVVNRERSALNFITWLGVVSGIVTLFAFIFALWVWMRSNVRVHELVGALQAIYDISGSILWETFNLYAEDVHTRLSQAERALGLASSIHTLSSKYVPDTPGYRATELGMLIERGIIWTNAMMWNIETSPTVKEVWLVTPDLKPDVSDTSTGALVGNNIRKGKKYVYFFPDNLNNQRDLVLRLKASLGVDSPRLRMVERLATVSVNAATFPMPPGTGNVVFYFKTSSKLGGGAAFREIVFTQVSERGLFWQECNETEAEEMYQMLRQKLEEEEKAAGSR